MNYFCGRFSDLFRGSRPDKISPALDLVFSKIAMLPTDTPEEEAASEIPSASKILSESKLLTSNHGSKFQIPSAASSFDNVRTSSDGAFTPMPLDDPDDTKDALKASQNSADKFDEDESVLSSSRSAEVLKLPSIVDLDDKAITSVATSKKRNFITDLASGLFMSATAWRESVRKSSQRESEEPDNLIVQKLSLKKHRRSAWNSKSISAAVSVMTRRNKWIGAPKKKLFITIFERYQQKIADRFGSCVAVFYAFLYDLLKMNFWLMIVWTVLIIIPQAVTFDYNCVNKKFSFFDLFKGKGVLGQTWLFFGNYEPKIGSYHLGFVYFLCTLFTLYFSLFWLIHGIVMALQEDGGHVILDNNTFSYLAFTSWDYSLKNPEATDILCLGIANSFRDLISDMELKRIVRTMKAVNKSRLYIRRAVAWLVTCFLIVLGCVIIYFVATADMLEFYQKKLGYKSATKANFIVTYTTSVVFGVVNVGIPFMVYQLPYFEYYVEPQTEIYISIIRVFTLTSTNIVCLMISLSLKLDRETDEVCGGTYIGQELFRIILVDIVFMVVGCMVMYIGYFLVCGLTKREFFLPTSLLRVINDQTIIWLGTIGCPVMPLLGCVYMIVVFAIYYRVVTKFCRPTSKRWLQPTRNVFFLIITIIALVVLTITFIVINAVEGHFMFSQMFGDGTNSTGEIKKQNPNYTQELCGPFDIHMERTPFQVFLNDTKLHEPFTGKFFDFICSPVTTFSLIFFLGATIYMLIHRLKWEVTRRLVLTAEVQMDQFSSSKIHYYKGKVKTTDGNT